MKNAHPLTVFVCIMGAAVPAALISDPFFLLSALVFGTAEAKFSGVRRIWAYFAVIPLAAVINPFFSHRGNTALFFINNSAVTLEAVAAGLDTGLMLCALLMWFAAYSKIMTTDKNLWLFGRFTPRIGLTLTTAIRFVPLLLRRFREISASQRAMGLYSSDAFPDRLKSRLLAFDAAFSWAIENGVTTAISMRARGYGRGKRSSYFLFRFSAADAAAALFVSAAATVTVLAGDKLRFAFYPEITRAAAAILPRTAYILLCAVPITAEIKERLQWKYSASKISALPTPLPNGLR